MKKFAAFAAAFVLLLSVFIIPGFAEEREFVSDEPLRDVQTSAPFDIFDISYYQYSGAFSSIQTTSVSPPEFQYIAVYTSDGEYVSSLSNGSFKVWRGFKTINGVENVVLYYNNASNYLVLGARDTHTNMTFVGTSTSSSLTLGGSSVAGTLVDASPVSYVGSSIFSVGSSLISFVTSSWLTLVALGAFLVVLCIGVIRRLVKGV